MINYTFEEKHDQLYNLRVSRKNAILLKPTKDILPNEKISIMSDVMFKTLFCNSKRMEYGAKLISYFIDKPYEEILKNIRLKNSELDKESIDSKAERCDYVAELDETLLNIEVNCNSDEETMLRNIEYVFRLYASNIKAGEEYNYHPVVQFNLNNFSFMGNNKTIDVYGIQNDDKLRLTNNIIIVQIYVPNILKKCYNVGIENLTEMERYIVLLATCDKELSNEISKGDNFMGKIFDEYLKTMSHDDLRESYDHEIAMKDWGYEEGHHEGREDGFKEGLQQGIEQGIEQGIKEGIEQGIKEGLEQKNKEAARELYKNGASNELIMNSLHITKEKLDEYIKEL